MSPHMLLKAEEISNLPPKKPQILKISRINITIVFLIEKINYNFEYFKLHYISNWFEEMKVFHSRNRVLFVKHKIALNLGRA